MSKISRWIAVILIFLFVYAGSAQASIIKGKGGLTMFLSVLDYSRLIGAIPQLPGSIQDVPATIRKRGLLLTYVGLKGYSDMIYPLRFGLEAAVGINMMSANTQFNARAYYVAPMIAWMPIRFVGLELSGGYHSVGFHRNNNYTMNHFVLFPKLIGEIPFSNAVALHLYAGFFFPLDKRIQKNMIRGSVPWKIKVTTGVMNAFTFGLAFVVSESIFGW